MATAPTSAAVGVCQSRIVQATLDEQEQQHRDHSAGVQPRPGPGQIGQSARRITGHLLRGHPVDPDRGSTARGRGDRRTAAGVSDPPQDRAVVAQPSYADPVGVESAAVVDDPHPHPAVQGPRRDQRIGHPRMSLHTAQCLAGGPGDRGHHRLGKRGPPRSATARSPPNSAPTPQGPAGDHHLRRQSSPLTQIRELDGGGAVSMT